MLLPSHSLLIASSMYKTSTLMLAVAWSFGDIVRYGFYIATISLPVPEVVL